MVPKSGSPVEGNVLHPMIYRVSAPSQGGFLAGCLNPSVSSNSPWSRKIWRTPRYDDGWYMDRSQSGLLFFFFLEPRELGDQKRDGSLGLGDDPYIVLFRLCNHYFSLKAMILLFFDQDFRGFFFWWLEVRNDDLAERKWWYSGFWGI